MKHLIVRVVLVFAIVLAGLWVRRELSPNPEKAIRKQLDALARAASSNSDKVAGFFTRDARITFDIPGELRGTFIGRDEVRVLAQTSRKTVGEFKVEFAGVTVRLDTDGHAATVNLTGRVKIPGEGSLLPQELNLAMEKVDGEWLIRRAETVKPLE